MVRGSKINRQVRVPQNSSLEGQNKTDIPIPKQTYFGAPNVNPINRILK
jgi:hypothetical protein